MEIVEVVEGVEVVENGFCVNLRDLRLTRAWRMGEGVGNIEQEILNIEGLSRFYAFFRG